MLELNAALKKEEFKFTDESGEQNELYVSEFSIKDTDRLIQMQKPLLAKESELITVFDLQISRLLCAVKCVKDDSYFWDCSIEEFKSKPYGSSMLAQLTNCVDELNPLSIDKLDEKKSKS